MVKMGHVEKINELSTGTLGAQRGGAVPIHFSKRGVRSALYVCKRVAVIPLG
jgi:hypothetical protein